MPRFRRLVGGIALLALAACGVAADRQPEHASRFAEEVSKRSLPDTEAAAALQARLGDPRLAGPDKEIERGWASAEAFRRVLKDQAGQGRQQAAWGAGALSAASVSAVPPAE